MVEVKFPGSEFSPRALYAAGICYSKADRQEQAADSWGKLSAAYPENSLVEESLYRKAVCEINMKQEDGAIHSLGVLLKSFPDGDYAVRGHYWQGVLHKNAERLKDAETAFKAAMKKKSKY